MKFIKIIPDYSCTGLYVIQNHKFYEPLDLDSDFLLLPDSLKHKIADWQNKFDKTLDQDRPQDSCFATIEDEDNFEKTGIQIWRELITLFPNDKTSYFSIKSHKLYATVTDYLNDFPKYKTELQELI